MKTNQHNSLDDIVFENKNKAYGAYYNRVTAGFDLMKSLLLVVSGIGIFALILSFTIEKKVTNPDYTEKIVPFKPLVLPPEIEKPVKPEKPAVSTKTVADDKTDLVPTPASNPEVQTEMRDNEDLSTVISGDENIDGEVNTGILTPQGNENGTDNGTETASTEAPENTNRTMLPRDVTQMAIFPGCERHADDKMKLQTCLSEKLQAELSTYMSFDEIAQKQGINEASARVQFVIDKSGKIVDVKTLSGGNAELSNESKQALERISKKLIQKGKYIQPAKFNDGTPVNLIFTIPVRFISN